MAKAHTFRDPVFQDAANAREALEALLWPDGPFCRRCGNNDPDKIAKLQGKSARPGLHYCNDCKRGFTVTVGTAFERSRAPLGKWWMAAHMASSGENGVSAHEIHRTIGVTYKTAWFMMRRLREATSYEPGSSGRRKRERASEEGPTDIHPHTHEGLQEGSFKKIRDHCADQPCGPGQVICR